MNGIMYFAHGHYIETKGINTKPVIDSVSAYKKFALYKQIPIDSIINFKAELVVKELTDESSDKTISARLAYKIYLKSNHKNNNEIGYLDASEGNIFYTEPKIREIGGTGTFYTMYNGTKQGYAEYYNGNYHLADYSRGAIIHVYETWGNDFDYIELSDNDNNWTQAEHASGYDDMGEDIFWGLQKIYDHLYNNYGISSYDDDDHPITAHIHYGADYEDKDFAGWFPDEEELAFGDGYIKYNPLASIDIVGHEFGHGINQFQIGWLYSGERAYMEEGLADIWGAIFEHRINSNSIWEMGELVRKDNYDCSRNLQNTHDEDAYYDMSNTYLSSFYNGITQNVVYRRSGILSHWFYLLVEGGEGYNELSNYYDVDGVGMNLAEDLIIKAVFNNYLDNTTTFSQLRTAFKNAALALCNNQYGELVKQVENAWYAVGVGYAPSHPTLSGSKYVCSSNLSYSVDNLPAGLTISWIPSSNITRISEQGSNPCIFKSILYGQGEGWIKATISNGCSSFDLVKNDIWVGAPDLDNITVYYSEDITGSYPNEFCPGDVNELLAREDPMVDMGLTSIYWDMGSWDVYYYDYEGYVLFEIPLSFSDYASVYYEVSNVCDVAITSEILYEGYCGGYYMMMTPNPASGETTLTIGSNDEPDSFDETTEWEIEVYDPLQNLKEKKTKLKGNSTKLQTAGWKEGIYIVRVKYKDEILTGKLIVKK